MESAQESSNPEGWISELQGPLTRYAISLGLSSHDAEDAVQDGLVALVQTLEMKPGTIRSPKAYAFTIVRNNANMPAVGEVNMNANGQDASYVRQPLAFKYHRLSGGPGCDAFPVQMRVNGSLDRVGILIEQVDEDYLKRFGYDDEQGEHFKLVYVYKGVNPQTAVKRGQALHGLFDGQVGRLAS